MKDDPSVHEIIVPVFLKVLLPAQDELQAEVKAVELVRSIGSYEGVEGKVTVHSVIAPCINNKNKQCPS